MHSVSWVSGQLGIAPRTLRIWERRYGIVHSTRSEAGDRLYDDDDLNILHAMAGLVAAGMQPAQAADQIRSGQTVSACEATPNTQTPAGLPDPAALIAASRSYDSIAIEDTLDAAFAGARLEYVVDVWLKAALVELEQAWAQGRPSVAQEHLISAAVMRRLAAAFDDAGHAGGGRHVLTGLAPGATHEIATFAFATMLRRAGLRVTYFGADLPVESWVHAVRTTRPDAVVIGAPRAADAQAATDVINALREATPATAVYVGGAGAAPGYVLDGTTLGEAAHWLADTLATRACRTGP